jgi:OPT family oligopeptide transporter
MRMTEFTWTAVILGLVMAVVLGAANAYLGLKAGQTIAATYPAAVIAMAVLKLKRGSILEENLARTAGSIGESVAAGAGFTIPAFVMSGAWLDFATPEAYWKSTVLMIVGSVLGVLFVSLVRRVMVEDRTLPFPESVAAAQIHIAGQSPVNAAARTVSSAASNAKYLFYNIGFGAAVFLLGQFKLFADNINYVLHVGAIGVSKLKRITSGDVPVGGMTQFAAPAVSPAYIGVGYIIGPAISALNFAGGVVAWGIMVPLLVYFMGPSLEPEVLANAQKAIAKARDANQHLNLPDAVEQSWGAMAVTIWYRIVRPIAVGGMLVGAGFTLFRMRKKIGAGLASAIRELGRKGAAPTNVGRTEQYMSAKSVFSMIGVAFAAMIGVYIYFTGDVISGATAAVVMLVAGFFFATVSGYLVGLIGSSNNPISGLTLSTLLVAALLMVALGVKGKEGVIAVLGVASVVCVSAAVAGELLQDFKVGYILGGTPRTIQKVELAAVILSSLVMFFPLLALHQGNINSGGTGFGDPKLPCPQAGLMAFMSQGIVGGEMAWPLIVVGILLGFAMILLQVKSPMLVSVGMYLPLATTFAIFVGGMIRGIVDLMAKKRGLNEAQTTRVGNVGILVASGFIVGEALTGLITATFLFLDWNIPEIFPNPSYLLGLGVMALLAWILIAVPLKNAGRPDEPAPPAAMM